MKIAFLALGVWYYAIISRISWFPSSNQGPQTVLVKVKDTQKAGWHNSPMFFCCFWNDQNSFAVFFYCANKWWNNMTTGEMFVEHVLFRFRSDSHIFAWQSALKTIAFLEELQVSLLGIWKITPPATWEVLFGPRPVEKDMSVAKLIERILEVGRFFLRILLGDLVTQTIWGHYGLGSF